MTANNTKRLSMDEAKEAIDYDCFIIDTHYYFETTREQNNNIKFVRFMIGIFDIFLINFITKLFVIETKYYIVILTLWIFSWAMYYFIWASIGLNSKKRWIDLKTTIAKQYFASTEHYDNMEEWVKDKVFRDEIAPIAGIKFINDDNKKNN